MARRRRSKGVQAEDIAKLIICGLLLISLAIGGITGFQSVFFLLLKIALGVALAAVVTAVVVRVRRNAREQRIEADWRAIRARENVDGDDLASAVSAAVRRSAVAPGESAPPSAVRAAQDVWTEPAIAAGIDGLDWYQFEKLTAYILRLEGWTVDRRGGAAPDGGVDLIVSRGGAKKVVQCKHWKNWKVKENVVRELVGSMTHLGIGSGAIHATAGWTQPAAELAAQHSIELVDRSAIAMRARQVLTDSQLTGWLRNAPRCCPKCDGPMVLRTGAFDPFWGCQKFPKCRGKIAIAERRTEDSPEAA